MQKTSGLYRRGEYWHIDKIVRVGDRSERLRGSTCCRSKEEAAEYLQQQIETARKRLIYGETKIERSFQDAASKYIDHLEGKGSDTERPLQDLIAVEPFIGDLPLSHVHQETMEPFYEAMKGKWKSGTVLRAVRTVVAVLNHAARVLRDGNSPWLAMAVPRITAPNWNDKRKPYIISWNEQDRIVNELPNHLIRPVLFALWAGPRQDEICGLQWSCEVEAQGMPKYSLWWLPETITKNGESRYLVCNRAARSIIASGEDNDSPFVFPSPKGGRFYRINNTAWKRMRLVTGIPIRVHDLRHTCGKRLEAAGIPWEYRKVILGHKIHDVTALYSGPGLIRILEQVEKVERDKVVVLVPKSVRAS